MKGSKNFIHPLSVDEFHESGKGVANRNESA
jgi:hypothetical protein